MKEKGRKKELKKKRKSSKEENLAKYKETNKKILEDMKCYLMK